MTVEKPKPKQLFRPITTEANSAMNQSQFLAITCNSLEAREKSRVHGAIGFGFDSHWLKNWRESFKPITKRSNRNHVITFDSHLKTALFYSSQLPIQPEKQLSNKQFYYISEVICMLLLVDLEVRILNSMYRLTSWIANPSSIPFLSGRFCL